MCIPDIEVCRPTVASCGVGLVCACRVTNQAGHDAGDIRPRFQLTPGSTLEPHVQIFIRETGQLIHDGAVEWDSDDPLVASVTDGLWVGGEVAGDAILTASVVDAGAPLNCVALVENAGPRRGAGSVRVMAFHEVLGRPVEGVTVVVDFPSEGVADETLTTDAQGYAETVAGAGEESYSVSLFHPEFHYVTLANIESRDVAVPLNARFSSSTYLGGASGKVDLGPYRERVWDGESKQLAIGVVGTSAPLSSLIDPEGNGFRWRSPSLDCGADPRPSGCYPVAHSTLFEGTLWSSLPSGLVVGTDAGAIKENFFVPGAPGHRAIWTVSLETDLPDLGSSVGVLLSALGGDCTCDIDAERCESSCPCDLNCGREPVTRTGILSRLLPILGRSGLGLRYAELPPTDGATWDVHRQVLEAGEAPSSATFPSLDDGGQGKLEIDRPLARFVEVSVLGLPPDPWDPEGRAMDALLLIAGVEIPGQGFVPVGASFGLDSDEGVTRYGRATNGRDGVVDGTLNCLPSIGSTEPVCRLGASPLSPPGRLGLFFTPPHAGMELLPRTTVVVTLPRAVIDGGADPARWSVALTRVPGELSSTWGCFGNCLFPGPPIFADFSDGTYAPSGERMPGLHQVTFSSGGAAHDRPLKWVVYFDAADPGLFRPPPLPDGFDVNPLVPTLGIGELPPGYVRISHALVRLTDTQPFESLVARQGSSLPQWIEHAYGFAVSSGKICAQSSGCP